VRKFLIRIAVLIAFIAALSILWIFGGRQMSILADRFGTMESASIPIKTVSYEGSGSGGTLRLNDLGLSLDTSAAGGSQPNIGTTKDGQLALSYRGKVFPFGPVPSGSDALAAAPPAGDDAAISIRHSALSWPTPTDINFMTGHSPSWKRHLYYQLNWKKQSGARLEMLWRFEQYYYPGDGWVAGQMTRENSSGLIQIEIKL
jgi:hypothetical protein